MLTGRKILNLACSRGAPHISQWRALATLSKVHVEQAHGMCWRRFRARLRELGLHLASGNFPSDNFASGDSCVNVNTPDATTDTHTHTHTHTQRLIYSHYSLGGIGGVCAVNLHLMLIRSLRYEYRSIMNMMSESLFVYLDQHDTS